MSVGVALAIVALALVALGIVLRGPVVLDVPDGFEPRPVSRERLEADVRTLCEDLSPRWYLEPGSMDRAANWIAERFRATDFEVTEQTFRIPEGEFRNVIATLRGRAPEAGVVVIGAHYDAYGGLPGADDNASGVAVLLELARTLPARERDRTLILVAFANEEPPFFTTEEMGSCHFARRLADEGTDVDLAIALDLVGYFSEEPGSQGPRASLLRLYRPSRGDFIAVVGDLGSSRPLRRVKRGMRAANALPVASFRAPKIVSGVDWSDHYWFRRLGMPAVMVTDTAFLRNPNYHTRGDTPETLDYERMAGVVQALHGVLWLDRTD
jgi:Zn-dependent M28 family amino/carboxypeptidase